jgi:hypothetical protein
VLNYPGKGVERASGWGPAGGVAKAAVFYAHQRHEVATEEALTFGRCRACTICLDPSDRGISRLAGSVEHDVKAWWLHNRCTSQALVAIDDMGIRRVVSPGRMTVDGSLTVIVEGSVRRHALEVCVHQEELPSGELPTAAQGEVLVNSLDHLSLVALFSGYLEPFPRYDPTRKAMPTWRSSSAGHAPPW